MKLETMERHNNSNVKFIITLTPYKGKNTYLCRELKTLFKMVKIISTESYCKGSKKSLVSVFGKTVSVNHDINRGKIWIRNRALDKFNDSLIEQTKKIGNGI